MTSPARRFGIIGLGRIGGGLARHALASGFAVVGHDAAGPPSALVEAGLEPAGDPTALAAALPAPRIVFLYVPAGRAVDALIERLAPALSRGDVVVDGGNSYWRDSQARHTRLAAAGIGFVDLGTSGGISGAAEGACFMTGGERAPVALVEPILRPLAVEGGYVHAGGPGAGHFVKLVHNGIEFGMLQAIGEGLALLEADRAMDLPIAEILRCWRHGSVIRSWLVDLLEAGYRERGGVAAVPAHVEDTGEVNWLVGDALHLEVAVPVIAQSVMQLVGSRDRARAADRAIALMRHGFGGHPFGPDAAVARERHEGRLADAQPTDAGG